MVCAPCLIPLVGGATAATGAATWSYALLAIGLLMIAGYWWYMTRPGDAPVCTRCSA